MYCRYCQTSNDYFAETCISCHRGLATIKDSLFISSHFVFVKGKKSEPIYLKIDGELQAFQETTIISRTEHEVQIRDESGDEKNRPISRRDDNVPLPAILPKRGKPNRLMPLTVVTDRKIYKKGDEARIFLVSPSTPNTNFEVEVKLTGQQILKTAVNLDGAGLFLYRYDVEDEGDYEIMVRPMEAADRQHHATCEFTCAAFTLSPLLATLQDYSLNDAHHLSLTVELKQVSALYNGTVECHILGGSTLIRKETIKVENGKLTYDLQLPRRWWGMADSISAEFTTPEGHTASVHLPNTSTFDRQAIELTPLTKQPTQAALNPSDRTSLPVRGIYLSEETNQRSKLLTLESVIATEGKLTVNEAADLVQINLTNPLTGQTAITNHREIPAGTIVSIPTNSEAPYFLFTVGVIMANVQQDPLQSFGVIIRPVDCETTLDVPEESQPGALLPVGISSSKKTSCLLVVYDARLEHEDPLPKLSKKLFEHLRSNRHAVQHVRPKPISELSSSELRRLAFSSNMPFGGGPVMLRSFAAAPDMMMTRSAAPMLEMAMAGDMKNVAIEEQIDEQVWTMGARESFPEVIHCELFEVDGSIEKIVKLGDQVGTWRCQAYFFQGLDWVKQSQDVRAELDLYTELDIPALASEGDDVWGQAIYHTNSPATLTISTSQGVHEHHVSGDGMVEFPINGPGKIETNISTADKFDVGRWEIPQPGVETVTASKLKLLRPGELLEEKNILIYPTPAALLEETIGALLQYPFG